MQEIILTTKSGNLFLLISKEYKKINVYARESISFDLLIKLCEIIYRGKE